MTESAIIGGAVVVLAALVAFAIWSDAQEASECQSRGGHIVTKTGTGITVNGQMATTSTSFCISQDGRILY